MADDKAKALEGLGDVQLKKAETVDKSAPAIDPDAKIKAAPKRTEQLAGIAEIELKPTETVDKSAPAIDPDTKVKESVRPALFAEIKKDD
jgi:hypothetical protein